ncbi:MAG: hypothetical protein R2695_14185 [Acidimicrobiales bacterium]
MVPPSTERSSSPLDVPATMVRSPDADTAASIDRIPPSTAAVCSQVAPSSSLRNIRPWPSPPNHVPPLSPASGRTVTAPIDRICPSNVTSFQVAPPSVLRVRSPNGRVTPITTSGSRGETSTQYASCSGVAEGSDHDNPPSVDFRTGPPFVTANTMSGLLGAYVTLRNGWVSPLSPSTISCHVAPRSVERISRVRTTASIVPFVA